MDGFPRTILLCGFPGSIRARINGRAMMFSLKRIEKGNAGTLPPASQSLLAVDAPNVIVQTFTRAEDGNGLIVRLREVAGRDTEANVSSLLFPAGKISAMITDIAEQDVKLCRVSGNSITAPVRGFGIETVRVVTGK